MIDDFRKLKLFTAGDIIEARLLQALLMSQGIDAIIKNESLQTGLGEIPFVEMWPEIWLIQRRDWDRAQRLLAGFVGAETNGEWSCPICGEQNPSTFELCWVCTDAPTDEANEFRA
jgi:hypothetical protein